VSARLTILRNAIAAQIRTVYTETDQVVIGSKTLPAVVPGWRVTMATGSSQPFTYGKREVAAGVYVQLLLGDFTGSEQERQDLIAEHFEAVCAQAVLGHQALKAQCLALSLPAGANPAFDLETLDLHDDEAVEAAGLPDMQILVRIKYTLP
jgi:hypothetical protein